MANYDTQIKVGPNGILTLEDLPFAEGQTVRVHIEPMDIQATRQKPFVFGLHSGQVWMSDDFDAPLPEEFWLGDGKREVAS